MLSGMSIHQTPGGRWRVRYYEAGQPNPRCRTFDSKKEAKDFEAALRLAKRTNTTVRRASTQTLEAFGAEYRQRYALVELSPNTLKVQASLWNSHVVPRLGKVPLATLAHEPEILQQFKADLKADGVGDGAAGKTLAIVSAVLTKAVEWNRIATNPAITIRKPPAKRKRVVEAISPEQVERLRAQTMELDPESWGSRPDRRQPPDLADGICGPASGRSTGADLGRHRRALDLGHEGPRAGRGRRDEDPA